MPLREKLIRMVAHFQRWPSVDLSRVGGKHVHKRHIILQNCRGVLSGQIPGFMLRHEDGHVEYFDRQKGREFISFHSPAQMWQAFSGDCSAIEPYSDLLFGKNESLFLMPC